MKKHAVAFLKLALFALLTCPPLARAHSVWLEDTPDQQLVIRFGEPGEDYEKSPGYLDSLTLPIAWKAGEENKPAALTVEKKSDHFLLVAANSAQAAQGETGFPVMKRKDGTGTRPFFFVRWLPAGAPASAEPALTLDLVPTGEAGAFRLLFRGQPLADHKIAVHAPGEKEAEAKTDAHGVVRVAAAKPGIHLLTANHRESVHGFAGGSAFERVSYNTAVSWRQP